jgi:hypothetical protein
MPPARLGFRTNHRSLHTATKRPLDPPAKQQHLGPNQDPGYFVPDLEFQSGTLFCVFLQFFAAVFDDFHLFSATSSNI